MTTKRTALPLLALLSTLFVAASATSARADMHTSEAHLHVSVTVATTCSISSFPQASSDVVDHGVALKCGAAPNVQMDTSAPRTIAYGSVQKQFVVTTIQF